MEKSEYPIAEPIPMKRELKLVAVVYLFYLVCYNCRAYPDEKGIETPSGSFE